MSTIARDKLVQEVNDVLVSGFRVPHEKINPEANLFVDLGLDSLDAVDLIVFLEEKLKVKVELEKFKEVRKLSHVYDLVEELIKNDSNRV